MLTKYTEIELQTLISNQIEENLHLDYKSADALQKTDGKKKEISIVVSSFANSDGGEIIYGIKEFDDLARRYLPERIDPVDRNKISKEWLEQVINSNIQPKISGVRITPISISGTPTNVVYVVTIPKSITAHQASDKKYYKRYNFESVPMEDFEVKDIINRQTNPVLHLMLSNTGTSIVQNIITIPIILVNTSIKVAKDVKLTLEINESERCEIASMVNLVDLTNLNPGKRLLGSMHDATIYKGLSIQVGTVSFTLLNNNTRLSFTSTTYADNMEPMIDNFEIEIVSNQVVYHLK